ncbi:hypothetical protein D3C72_2348820 [compost metagenome]
MVARCSRVKASLKRLFSRYRTPIRSCWFTIGSASTERGLRAWMTGSRVNGPCRLASPSTTLERLRMT